MPRCGPTSPSAALRSGERDLMIGATAIARNYTVATRDERSFSKIPGLNVQLL